jgi:hypothetical protein
VVTVVLEDLGRQAFRATGFPRGGQHDRSPGGAMSDRGEQGG